MNTVSGPGGFGAVRDHISYGKIGEDEDPGFDDHRGDGRSDIREGGDQKEY